VAVLAVSDTGAGSAADLLPRVFDLFVQASDAETSGMGIGLSLVRGLVELHGGTVEAESDGERPREPPSPSASRSCPPVLADLLTSRRAARASPRANFPFLGFADLGVGQLQVLQRVIDRAATARRMNHLLSAG